MKGSLSSESSVADQIEAPAQPDYLLVGGLHLVTTPDPDIERLAQALHEV
ncbi:MAG TPA: hypothetical protein VFZ18_14315 [Longimicrobiaceae bacterium]